MARSVQDALQRAFRPELLNRIDETIVFHPLSRAQIGEIVGLMVGRGAEAAGGAGHHLRVDRGWLATGW